MTLERIELSTLFSESDFAEFQALAYAVQECTVRIQEVHPAYSWRRTDEIVCRGCGDRLEIPILTSTKPVADRVFADHQQFHLGHMLNDDRRHGPRQE
jgi:hypothetical protein